MPNEPQQESWQDRLAKWVETQHGTAGWELKLEAFISSERTRLLGEVRGLIKSKKLPVPNPYGTTVRVEKYNQVIDDLLKALDTLGEK